MGLNYGALIAVAFVNCCTLSLATVWERWKAGGNEKGDDNEDEKQEKQEEDKKAKEQKATEDQGDGNGDLNSYRS